MSSSATLYDQINSSWPRDLDAPSDQEAVTGAKRLWKFATGQTWRGPVKITSGGRYTWIRGGVLHVNPRGRGNAHIRGGWPDICHDLSHLANYHLGRGGHDEDQSVLERELQQYCLDHGFHLGKLKRKTQEKPARDLVKERYEKILAREANWAKKFKRAQTALKKVNRERATYEKRHGSRVTG